MAVSSQIHDLGYRSYDGERAGAGWAMRSLALHSVRRALGLKRAARHKIAPALAILISFLPAIVLAGAAAFLGGEIIPDLIGYGEYFNITGFAVFLFTASVAPGVITTDRTNGMLAMYLASPLTRTTYVIARALGIFAVLLIVTVGPIVFLVLGYTFAGAGPGGIWGFTQVMARAIVAGTLAAALFTGIGVFISSIPRRWGIASLAIVGFMLISGGVAVGLTEGTNVSDWLAMASPGDVMAKASEHLMDDVRPSVMAYEDRSGAVMIAAAVGYTVLSLVAAWWRYQHIEVER